MKPQRMPDWVFVVAVLVLAPVVIVALVLVKTDDDAPIWAWAVVAIFCATYIAYSIRHTVTTWHEPTRRRLDWWDRTTYEVALLPGLAIASGGVATAQAGWGLVLGPPIALAGLAVYAIAIRHLRKPARDA